MDNLHKNYLEHHGILNQKWGRRNGPPYPLDKEDHSAAEKKTLSKSFSGKRHEEMYDRKTNSNAQLSEKEKNKISKKYQKLASKSQKEVVNTSNYVKGYNQAVNKINNGLIDKYNSDYEKKLKKAGIDTEKYDYSDDEKYFAGYQKMFDDVFNKEYNQVLAEAYRNNKNYKKAKELVDKYSMKDWDDLARQNEEYMKEFLKFDTQ